MNRIHTIIVACAALSTAACQSTSQAAQQLFTPDHFDPPTLYGGGSDANPSSLIIGTGDKARLNTGHPNVFAFQQSAAMDDDAFVQVAYSYLTVADQLCRDRVADLTQARVASNSGFGMLTTLSAVTGSALSSSNGANAAAGAAAFFNSLTTNASGVQSDITSLYSSNIVNGIELAKTTQKKSIISNLDTLGKSTSTSPSLGQQAQIRYQLQEYNNHCTIGAGQRQIENSIKPTE